MTPQSIQNARLARGWTVADLAGRVGVSPRTVEGWEQGRPISATAKLVLVAVISKNLSSPPMGGVPK